eukprot:4351535-Ditylum_brightwellii.AAC.1
MHGMEKSQSKAYRTGDTGIAKTESYEVWGICVGCSTSTRFEHWTICVLLWRREVVMRRIGFLESNWDLLTLVLVVWDGVMKKGPPTP